MKALLQWMHDHPLKAVLFSVFFTFISTFAGFRTDLLWLAVACYSVGLAMLGIWMWLDEADRDNRILLKSAREFAEKEKRDGSN